MENKQCIIEVTEKLKMETEASPDEPERWKRRSIYKIPVHAVNLNKDAYFPWVAAIGPYHRDDDQLQRMEVHKKRALRHLLHKSKKPLESYVGALVEVVGELKDAYGHLDEAWEKDTEKFLQVMILDGCFILETMRADQSEADAYPGDIVFSCHGKRNVIPCIKRDMLLLENQLPLLVLQKLHAVSKSDGHDPEKSESQVIELILKSYGRSTSMKLGKCLHILDVYRKSMIMEVEREVQASRPAKEGSVVHSISATELKEAGIQFKKGMHNMLKDIKFQHRTLRLPRISLDDTSESAYLNMVAFERLHIGSGSEISSYIYFMNRLVSNERDVILLKKEGIIQNDMATDKAVAKLFCKLSKEILLDSDTWLDVVYTDINKKLGNVFGEFLFKSRYSLFHTYFRSPWAMISVTAAALALGLSIAQLIYAVISFIHRDDATPKP